MKLPHFKISYGKRLHPARDWWILIGVAGLLIAASLGWNLWLFNRVLSGAVLGAAPTPTLSTIDDESIETLTKLLAEREGLRSLYANGERHFVDPSE